VKSGIVTVTAEEPLELPSGTYLHIVHVNPILTPFAPIIAELTKTLKQIQGLTVLNVRIVKREKEEIKDYIWISTPITYIEEPHHDIEITYRVASPIAISTIVALILIVLAIFGLVLIVHSIHKLPPMIALPLIILVGLIILAWIERRKRR